MTDATQPFRRQPREGGNALRRRVADLKARAAALVRSEARYRSLFSQSCHGILVIDQEGAIRDANPRALAMLGYSLDELRARGVAGLVHPDDLRAVPFRQGPEIALAGRSVTVERRYRRKGGDWLPVLEQCGVFDAEKRLFQILFHDATPTRAAEAARAASEAKSAFLANMSHEIRTPLNGIMGMLQLALAATPTDEQRDYLATALSSAEALLCILSDVLDVSRLDAGRMELCDEVFTLEDIIRPMADSFVVEARLKGVEFTSRVDPATPERLRGDSARLRQILYNLVANAIKYTPSGGVHLDVAPAAKAIPGEDGAVALDFVVADTGIGIAPEKQESIFDAFSQADFSLTRPYGGMGLGLAIVRGLTDLMGGQLHICSQQGRGTTVRVRLRLPLGPTEGPRADRPPLPHLAGVRVLVVEDEQINQMTIRAMLRRFGCHIVMAANGREALDRLAGEDFDCVLMDMQMPVLDGLETTRRLRRGVDGVRSPGLPVIALTAHALDEDRELAVAAGVSDYISKPVEMDGLARTIGRCLGLDG